MQVEIIIKCDLNTGSINYGLSDGANTLIVIGMLETVKKLVQDKNTAAPTDKKILSPGLSLA